MTPAVGQPTNEPEAAPPAQAPAKRSWKLGWLWVPLAIVAVLLIQRFGQQFGLHRIREFDSLTDGKANGSVMVDFRDALYLPFWHLVHGGNPYDPVSYVAANPQAADFGLYSPGNFLLFAPVLSLPWSLATVAWVLLVEVPAVAVLVWFAWRRLGAPRRLDVVLGCVCAALLWLPMNDVLKLGNPSIVTTTAVLVALWPTSSKRAATAANMLAWLKPHFGLPVAVLSGAGGRLGPMWRGLVLAVILALPATVLAIVHAGGVGSFLASIPANIKHTANSPFGGSPLTPGRFDSIGLISRMIGSPLPTVVQAVVFLAVVAAGAFGYAALKRHGQPELALAAGVLTVLLSIHQNLDDFAAGFVVVAALVGVLWSRREAGTWRPRFTAWWAVAGVAVLLIVAGFRQPQIDSILGIPGVTGLTIDAVLAAAAWLACLGTAVYLSRRPAPAGAGAEAETPTAVTATA